MRTISSANLSKIIFGPHDKSIREDLEYFIGDTVHSHQLAAVAAAVLPIIMAEIVTVGNLELTVDWDFAPTTQEQKESLINAACVHMAKDLHVYYEATAASLLPRAS